MKMKTTKLKRSLMGFAVSLLLFFALPASAQLASWSPAGVFGYGPSPWAPTATSASISAGGWVRGAGVGLTGTSANNAWGGVNWTGQPTEDATFTITSNPGSIVSYSLFNLYYRRSGTGPGSGTFEYAFGNSSTTYTVISNLVFGSATSGGSIPINLSGVNDLQNVQPGTVVKFRILPSGGGPAGTWYIYGSGADIEGSFSGFGMSISTASAISCNGQSNGALTASLTGGTGPFSYSWTPSGLTSSVAAGLSAGVYTCFVTSALSETTFATYTLTQPAVVSASVVSQANVICYGSSTGAASLAPMGGTPAYTYSWLPSGGTSTTAANLAAGIYTLNIVDSHSCTGTQTVAITQPGPTLISYASNSVICNGSTVTVNTAGTGTYTWTNGLTSGVPFTPSNTATYTVSTTNTVSGCTETNTITIVVNQNPTVTAASDVSTTCSGSSVTLNASGASTLVWSGGITDGVAFTPTITTSYTVTGTDVNNCSSTAEITVTVNALPTLSVTSSKSVTCKGGTATLTVRGATSYSWNTNSTASLVAVSPTITTTYSISGMDDNGCVSTSAFTQTVSNCLGVETLSANEAANLVVFPNPANGEFTVKNTSDLDLLVVNSLGQTVQTLQLNDSNNREAKVSNLSPGIYFIVSMHTGFSVKQKVIVSK